MPRVPEYNVRREAGKRLKAALDGFYPRARGGLRKLADDAKIGPETLYRWFRGTTEPDLGSLARVAAACKVRRVDLVAVMDGVPAPTQKEPPPEWAGELMTRDEVQAMVAEVQGAVTREIEENRRVTRQAIVGDGDPDQDLLDLVKEELRPVMEALAGRFREEVRQLLDARLGEADAD